MYNYINYPPMPPPIGQTYQVDQGTVAQYYCTIPPVYNYSHYSSIEKLYLQKAEKGSIFEERTPYMNNLTSKAPRGVKTDDHLFEYMKAEEADILLNMRMLDPFSQEYKNLKQKLDYTQELISTFMQKKNPRVNLDLVHYGELPFMSDVEQILKQEARELYFKKQQQQNKDNQGFKYFQNKLVITDPYNPQDGFYLTFEFINWIPDDIAKIYIKYGFSKRNNQYIPYRSTKEYIPEQNPISQYNTTCFFGNQDYVKGVKPDKDELLYLEIWFTTKGELPEKWRLFGWSLHEIFDPMGVFMGGAFKVPVYDGMYERNLINKVGLPYLTNGYFYFRLFLPEHFPPNYSIDPFSEHYFVPKLHLKNQDKAVNESILKKRQIAEERLKEINNKKNIIHSKHEGQVKEHEDILDQYSRPGTQSSQNNPANLQQQQQDKLWGYSYNYNKIDKDKMINRLTKQLNKHYLDSLVNPDMKSEDYFNINQINLNKSQLGNTFLEKSLEQQILEFMPSSIQKQQELEKKQLTQDGIHFKITKIINIQENIDELINIRGALIQDDTIIQDASRQPCVIACQTKTKKLMKNSYSIEFQHTFPTRNNDVLGEFSYHNFQNAIILFTIYNDKGKPIGWMYAPLLKINGKYIQLNTGKFRVRICQFPVQSPPLNYTKIKYTDMAIEYTLMEGNMLPQEEESIQIDPLLLQQQNKTEENQLDGSKDQILQQDEASQIDQINVKQGDNNNPNESKQNNESTMININPNASLIGEESQNKTGIIEQLLNKSLFDNPTALKHISIFMDGLINLNDKIPITFKVSLLKDSIICSDDSKAKISFQCNEYKTANEEGDIELLEEVMIDLDMKKLVEKNKKTLDKYNIVINILDQKGNLLYWHFTPLFKKEDILNIEDFQVKLYNPPFQVPTRINYKKITESNVICKYGIAFTDNSQLLQQQKQLNQSK